MKYLILLSVTVLSIGTAEAATFDDRLKASLIRPGVVCTSAYVTGESLPDQALALADAAISCLELGGTVVPTSTFYCAGSGFGTPDGGGIASVQCSVECRTCSRDLPTDQAPIGLD